MRPIRTAAVTTFVALAACGLVACGGDSGGDSGTGESAAPTKAAYIEQVDAICQTLYEQRDPLEAEAARAGQAGELDRAADVFDNAAEITQNRLDEIRAVTPPSEPGPYLPVFLRSLALTVDTARGAAQALRDDDAKALQGESRRGFRITTRLNKAAIRYGFLVCGRGQSVQIG